MPRAIGGQKGFTLIEIVMVIVILGVIGAFTFQFVGHAVQAFKKSSARKDLYDQGRLALERMVRELRDGKEITDCSSNSITFKKAHPAQAADNIEEVKFELVGTDLKRVGDPSGTPQTSILASNVTSFQVGEAGGGDSVTVDAVSTGTITTGDIMTISHTTGSGSDRLMLVGVSINNDSYETVDGITYNGIALTPVGTEATSDDARVEIWRLVAPSTGTHNVVITFSALLEQEAHAGVMTFAGVDQTTPLGTFVSDHHDGSTPATVDIPSASGELVFGVAASEYEALTASSGQDERWNLSVSSTYGAGGTAAGAAPTVTMSWDLGSADHWAIGGVSIKPSGTSGSTPCEVGGLTTAFSDDFEDGVITDWSKVSGDDMAEAGGVFTTTGNNVSHYTVDVGSGWTDYSFDVDAMANDDDVVGITFRVEDSDSFYVLDQRFGEGSWNLRLRLNDNGTWSTLDSVANQGTNPGQVNSETTWYNFKVELSGTNIKAYIDNVLKFDINDATVSGGTVGLWLEWSGGTDFDDVLVQSAGGYNLNLIPLNLTLSSPEGGDVTMRTKVFLRNVE